MDRNELIEWLQRQPSDKVDPKKLIEFFNSRMSTKKSKKVLPSHERCIACIREIDGDGNNVRCSRHRKSDALFCGTHIMSQPYGVVNEPNVEIEPTPAPVSAAIRTCEISGIPYFIDDDHNVYHTTEMMKKMYQGGELARIVGRWSRDHVGAYSLTMF